MPRISRIVKPSLVFVLLVCSGLLFFSQPLSQTISAAPAQAGYDPTNQSAALLYDEARTVYLGNLARRDHGVPPLRWNLQLTHAARWFSWDSVENRPNGYCGHTDTLGRAPWDRTPLFGYLGFTGAENAFCGYVTPESAIQGWMESPGHRENLLNPSFQEIGLGYYRRSSDGRGYVTQDFGVDSAYTPVIIENEALFTASQNVNLYIYSRQATSGFEGLGEAAQIMVSNTPQFSGASWEPYNPNKAWTLASGTGWRTVYLKTRDKLNRTSTVSDTIYLGATVPLNEIGPAQMSTTQSKVTIYNSNGGWPQMQFSPGWMADDSDSSFKVWWGNGVSVSDSGAVGGTAYRLYPGNGESFAWVYDWGFIRDTPMVAYFRLKVNDNTSTSEVARISVDGGGTEYGLTSLHGVDFAAPNQYQEFAIPFTFNTNPNDEFLKFNFWRSGNADLYVDTVYIFTAAQPAASPITWTIPGGNYRGQGIWVRYTNGSQFSGISEAITTPYTISGSTGVGGTIISFNDGAPRSVEVDGAGNYSIPVPYGWSGTMTPSHPCYAFTPSSRSYTNITTNQTGQNFTAAYNNAPACAVTVGVFRPSNGLLYLRNSNTSGYADIAINYGLSGDYPVAGDWDGDGDDTIGIYRNGTFYLRNSNTPGFADLTFSFGAAGDQPVAGDWDDDGTDTIGVYRPSTGAFYLRNENSAGAPAISFYLGNAGDVGIAGDWNGDGLDTTGVFRPSNGVIFLKNKNETGFAEVALNYGLAGDKPVVGDWDNDGDTTIGIYRNGKFFLRNSNTNGFADITLFLGIPGDMPIAGNWDGKP